MLDIIPNSNVFEKLSAKPRFVDGIAINESHKTPSLFTTDTEGESTSGTDDGPFDSTFEQYGDDDEPKQPEQTPHYIPFKGVVNQDTGKPIKAKQPAAKPPQVETNQAPAAKPTLKLAFDKWKKYPTPANMGQILQQADPVITIALRNYASGGTPVLRSKARLMAAEAIKRYDPTTKVPLKSWLLTSLQPLRNESHSTSPIVAPEKVRLDSFALHKFKNEFQQENGRDPTMDELADGTGLSPKRILYVQNFMRPVISEGQMSNWSGSESDDNPDIHIPDDSAAVNTAMNYVYHDLDPVNKQIYDMYLGRSGHPRDMTVQDMAKKLNLTSGAISQRANRISKLIEQSIPLEMPHTSYAAQVPGQPVAEAADMGDMTSEL